jgi:opacity protein-like surface antigen
MRAITSAVLLFSAATAAFAQQWEFGAVGGGSFLNSVSATSAAGNATAGFAPGFVAGVFVGQTLYKNISGEIRYEYMQSDLRLSAGGQTAQFSGATHTFHYDLVYHTNRSESRTQFFGALGGGVKDFVGTGTEEAIQPLQQYGYFTKTHALKPMVTAGAGVTYALRPNLFLRAEVRDFITAFPTAVLTPAPGVKFGNLLNDIVPMVSIVYQK